MLACVALGACDQLRANRNICLPLMPEKADQEWLIKEMAGKEPARRQGAAERYLQGCVERWAYRLARSSDPANVVADAVMGACAADVARVAEAQVVLNVKNNKDLGLQADPSAGFYERTGKAAPVYAVFWDEYRARALYHVVQARAGDCPVPELSY